MGSQTVGVVIPVYNGALTIIETLKSVCAQTYRDLDIVVVDDGSTDESRSIVQALEDPRIRLITQRNAGVAAARNNGALATDAAYLAFVDADDTWSPEKIEAQMEVLSRHPNALVWCWFKEIDDHGNVLRVPDLSSAETLSDLCGWNIVGNGSSMLVSRRAFNEAGGFDTTLRDRGAQGCEDYSFALRVADKFPIKVLCERLVGYRITSTSMSADIRRMWRSYNIVLDEFAIIRPEYRRELESSRNAFQFFLYYRALEVRDFDAAIWLYKIFRRRLIIVPGMKRSLARAWVRSKMDMVQGRGSYRMPKVLMNL